MNYADQTAPAVGKDTAIQDLVKQARDKVNSLRACSNRLEKALDRLEPSPRPADQSIDKTPDPNGMPGLRHQLTSIGEELQRLSNICDRVETLF